MPINKVAGVNIDDPQEEHRIYERYLQAFKKGAYNYIKEEKDPVTQQVIPRKYFSGGEDYTHLPIRIDRAMSIGPVQKAKNFLSLTVQIFKLAANRPQRLGLYAYGTRFNADRSIAFIKKLGKIKSPRSQEELWKLLFLMEDEAKHRKQGPLYWKVVKQIADEIIQDGGEKGAVVQNVINELELGNQIPRVNAQYHDELLYPALASAIEIYQSGFHPVYYRSSYRVDKGEAFIYDLNTEEGRIKHVERAFKQSYAEGLAPAVASLDNQSLRLQYAKRFLEEFSDSQGLETIVNTLDKKAAPREAQ